MKEYALSAVINSLLNWRSASAASFFVAWKFKWTSYLKQYLTKPIKNFNIRREPVSEDKMEQALQGNIGRFTLPEILQLIADSRKTGTLGIQNEDDIVMVYFERGRIIYGYGPRQTYHLGQLLREKGRLTDRQLEDAVRTQARKESSKRLGQILIDKKYIERGDLEQVVRQQVEGLIYSLLSWHKGTFKFYENQYPTDEEITVDISVENAILEGCRRIDELNRIKEVLPDFSTVLALSSASTDREAKISLNPDEWNLLSLINGQRQIDDIVKLSMLPQVAALNKLAALKLAGLIKVVEKPEEEPDRIKTMVDKVSDLLEEYLNQQQKTQKEEKTILYDIDRPTVSRLTQEEISSADVGEDN